MADPGNGAERSLLAHILSASAFVDCGEEGEEGEEGEKPPSQNGGKTERSTTPWNQNPPSAIRQLERTSLHHGLQCEYPTNRIAPSRLTDPTSLEDPDRDEQRTTHRSDCAYRVRWMRVCEKRKEEAVG